MRLRLIRKPSASMVVALLALIVAASGTAVAATHLVSGDKLIKKHSLSGNRLRNKTITASQVNFKKLGTVPKANQANSATNATNATNAVNALNAAALGGKAAGSYIDNSMLHRSGLVTLNSGQTGVALVTAGSVSETADCTTSGATNTATVNQTSTRAGWWDFGTLQAQAGVSENFAESNSTSSPRGGTGRIQMVGPDGSSLQGQIWAAVNWPNAGQCSFVADATS